MSITEKCMALKRGSAEVRKKLEGATKWLDEAAEGSEGQNKLGDAIFTILQTLLDLWIDIIAAVRTKPLESFEDGIDAKRRREMAKISGTVLQFHEMVVNQAELRDRAQAPVHQVASVTITENGVTSPIEELRQQRFWRCTIGAFAWNRRVGKTQIARAFAHRNDPGFDAIFWVKSDTEVNIMADFTRIALSLNLPEASHESQTGSWFLFTRWLNEQQSSRKTLVDHL
ncbi:hypothetical protein VTL71DRAFT_11262 [Oculimacula yallundae]|uniref:Uncharacterized protein n=1 Tax=Oculimacula yallundae TaxID=86028 RepID=A0ABR4CXM7_9HELO